MIFLTKYIIPSRVSLGLILILVSCSSAKKVDFKSPVDTTTKNIKFQVKQTYNLPQLGVYASNDFDGFYTALLRLH